MQHVGGGWCHGTAGSVVVCDAGTSFQITAFQPCSASGLTLYECICDGS